MIRFVVLAAAGFVLAGCVTDQPPPPVISVAGPVFAATDFDCGKRPVPPNPASVANAGSAAAHYENRLGTWGQHCSNQLSSVGHQLAGAGQVAK